MVPFLNEVIGPYVFTIFCVDYFRLDKDGRWISRGGILKNGHEVSSRVGDMSRTFNHLFNLININFTYMFTSRETFLGKRGAREHFLVKEEQGNISW